MKNQIIIYTFIALAGLFFSCQSGNSGQATNTSSETEKSAVTKGQSQVKDDLSQPNILQIAAGSKDHTTLAAGVQAAGLEDVLVNAGPLTVFAPTNAAFDKLPEGTLETLLKPENKATLARIIKFHASPGSYDAEKLRDGMNLFQATGHNVKIAKKDGKITVNGANILGTVAASNGIVHVIDQVLLPPEN